MDEYLKLLNHIMQNGSEKDDRTGTGTKSVFGYQMRFDLNKGFPLLTTKKMYIRSIIHELLWFLTGNTNIRYLAKNKVHIWDEWPFQGYLNSNDLEKDFPMYSDSWKEKKKWFINQIKENEDFAKKYGDLGPVYGKQWRDFDGVDQISWVLKEIKKTKENKYYRSSRRLLVSAWNVSDIQTLIKGKTSAPPLCHTMFQFYVRNNKLSCQLYQRSADVFLGVPFNIASYSLLTMMIAQITELELGDFVHTFGDAHLYNNHLEQTNLQLSREPKELPKMILNPNVTNLFDFKFEDFELKDYNPHPRIKAPIAV